MGFRLTNDTPHAEGTPVSAPLFGQDQRPFLLAKRVVDFILATSALIFLSPFILLMAMLVWIIDGRPAIYAQVRVGKNGRKFKCYKLRTMVRDAEQRLEELLAADPDLRAEWEAEQKLRHDPRVTPFGHFLRRTSIDELPQLLNVVLGHMSLVGPRPICIDEIPKYADKFEHYCSVDPGLTGLWQIRGRSNTTYKQRVLLDATYAQTRTFWGDIKIMLLTVPAVLRSNGAH